MVAAESARAGLAEVVTAANAHRLIDEHDRQGTPAAERLAQIRRFTGQKAPHPGAHFVVAGEFGEVLGSVGLQIESYGHDMKRRAEVARAVLNFPELGRERAGGWRRRADAAEEPHAPLDVACSERAPALLDQVECLDGAAPRPRRRRRS